MAKQLSDFAGATEHTRLDKLVGEYILLLYAERAESQQFGQGVRMEFRLCDAQGVPKGDQLLDAFSFAPGVRRAVERLWGPEGSFWADDEGVVCQVVRVGAGIGLA